MHARRRDNINCFQINLQHPRKATSNLGLLINQNNVDITYIQEPYTINTLWTGDADFSSLHYNCARRMTQICVFNTRLVSTHYTLHYAIHGAFLRMLPLTDIYTRVGTLIVATIYLQLIQNRYMFRSFTVLQCSHQHCVQPAASDVEVVGYL